MFLFCRRSVVDTYSRIFVQNKMDINSLTAEIFNRTENRSLSSILDCVNSILEDTVLSSDDLKADFVDGDFLKEIHQITSENQVELLFGESLRDLQCVYRDGCHRKPVLNVKCLDKNRFKVSSVLLPPAEFHGRDFLKLEQLIKAFIDQVDLLQSYFAELERIDEMCTVVDPPEPSFKYDYRNILLDTRAWLHINVTSEGLPANVNVVGNIPPWYQTLQDGLPNWDYDEPIIDNIMKIFDLTVFPTQRHLSQDTASLSQAAPSCGICLMAAGARPLCASPKCSVYYHRACLYAWLVSCGARTALGIAAGACPNCGGNISCPEKDD